MEAILRDLRFGLRSLLKAPGFTTVAILTLALGIGANTTMFSIVSYALLRPVPYAEPERLVRLNESSRSFPHMSVAYPNYLDWRAQTADVFEELACSRRESMNLTGFGEAERVFTRMASGNFFSTLKVTPALGRNFTDQDDKPGAQRTAIVSHAFWKRRLQGDPASIGKTISLSGDAYTVVGVLPADFRFGAGDPVDVWVPIGLFAKLFEQRGAHPGIYGIGRLKPGVTIERARASLAAVAERLQKQYPDHVSPGQGVTVRAMREVQVQDSQTALLVLWGATAVVLLIAAANVANLMLARAAARQGELAVRVALGAGRKHLVLQLLTESLILALFGGILGTVLSVWGVDALTALLPDSVARASDMRVDGLALGFTLLISVVTGVGFGLLPAWRTANTDLHGYLKEGRASADPRRQRLRNALVVAEVALALVLLIGAGLLLRSFRELLHVKPGFRPENVLTIEISLPMNRYGKTQELIAFDAELRRRFAAVPGVKAVTVAGGMPFLGASETSFTIEGRPPLKPGETNMANIYPVSPEYLDAMGIRLVKGRFFTEADGDPNKPVLVIDDALARKHFPNQDPIGQRFEARPGMGKPAIVGVVEHTLQYGLDGTGAVDQAFYTPWKSLAAVAPQYASGLNVAVRTTVPPLSLAQALRKEVQAIDPELPVYQVQTMEAAMASSISDRRFAMLLLSLFAAVALTLASVGIYGVMSYTVTQRTRELGIRLALGAQRGSVMQLVVGQAARLAAVGLGAGLLAAFAASRALASMLYGVSASDPLTYAAVAVILGGVALLASWLPARRATRVDPIIALRAE